ncbi:MAG: hypothetical protein U0527_16775 [Candidatus Eisenbacteria bacterium]
MRSNWAVALVAITAMVGLGASRAGAEPLTAGRIQHYVPDARARAMGQSFVAVTDGKWSAWANPAALAWTRGKVQGAYSYLALPEPHQTSRNPTEFFRAATLSAGRGGMGVGLYWARLNYPDFHEDFELIYRHGHETDTRLSSGVDVLRLVRRRPSAVGVALGATVKRVTLHLAPTSYTSLTSGAQTDADLGLLVTGRLEQGRGARRIGTFIGSFGWSRRNLFDRHVVDEDQHQSEPLGTTNRYGAALRWETGLRHELGPDLEVTLATDQGLPPPGVQHGTVKTVGLEVLVQQTASIRLGHVKDPKGIFTGDTWGLGLSPDLLLRRWSGSMHARIDFASIEQASYRGGKSEQWALVVSFGGPVRTGARVLAD